ncbi:MULTISPECIES: response regulator transcription factor [Corallococcus]|uniref:LuxR C-terminal-related transcriptional regulator n=1 Tax=Corallococcus TaxID=83461 RepID=UPI00117C1FF0|nr:MULTISPECIES: response regulator transcription factor [Corallococcus]NBD09793.1 DNA-binding response regulator [Corallococcus silvisoli]TSC23980.1 response regulator transcription factor [Corallococcus sp. Z5C101001]
MLDAPASSSRLALVSEDPLARGALARALSDQAEGWTVAAAGTQVELESARGEPPDVVLWDTGLRLVEGAAPDLGAPVLALVADEAAGELALGAGARGLLFRDVSPGMLVAALHAVSRGLAVFDPGLTQVRAAPRSTAPSGAPGPDTLTPREREVLGLLAEGLSNKAIADRLDISEHTAKFHVNAVLAKLGVQRRTEAVVRAARMGLVTL